jgi:arsenite-transporting ATPase
LTVSRIDPHVETARYREHVLNTKGATLDVQGHALLEGDLRSPCTEEIAVFQAFSHRYRASVRRASCRESMQSRRTTPLVAQWYRCSRTSRSESSGCWRLPRPKLSQPKERDVWT